MELFYYNGKAFEKMSGFVFIRQGERKIPGGVKRVRYKTRNVRGYRKPYDPQKS